MATMYSRFALLSILESMSKVRLESQLWCALSQNGISQLQPTRRGCRTGRRKVKSLDIRWETWKHSTLLDIETFNSLNDFGDQDRGHLHISSSNLLNIQVDTSGSGNHNNSILASRLAVSTIDPALDTGLQMTQSERPLLEKSAYHVMKIMVTNVAPKIDEVQEFIHRSKAGLVFITETWLKSSIQDSVIDISGYTILRKDRSLDNHSGVCIFLKDDAFALVNSRAVMSIKRYGCSYALLPSKGLFLSNRCCYISSLLDKARERFNA